MKNLKKIVPLLMAGAMLVSPVSMSAQAKEIDSNIKESTVIAVGERAYSLKAKINGSNVALRRTAGLSGTVISYLQKDSIVYVDESKTLKVDGIWWNACKYGEIYGYVAAQYVSK